MKTILTMAISVMIFTGAMAQQNSKKVSMQTKATEAVKSNNNSIEGSQSAHAEAVLNAQDLKSKAKEKKAATRQKLEATKKAITNEVERTEASSSTEVGIEGTTNSDNHGAEVSQIANSAITAETKGSVVSNVASVTGQGNAAVKNIGANINGQLNSSVKSIPAAIKTDVNVKPDVNVKTDVIVKTDMDIKPATINTKVRAATGIKL